MGRIKEDIEYYVSVGANGIGYETRCKTLEEARELYRYRKEWERDDVTLYKYNHTRHEKTIINHRKSIYK